MYLSKCFESRCNQLEGLGFEVVHACHFALKIKVSLHDVEFTVDGSFIEVFDVLELYGSLCYNKGFQKGSDNIKRKLKELTTLSEED